MTCVTTMYVYNTNSDYVYLVNYNPSNKTNSNKGFLPLFSDLSGKMFTFPQETNTARVVLTALKSGEFSAVTVCHRYAECEKCIKNNPSLISDYEKYHDNHVFVIHTGPLQSSVEITAFSLWPHRLISMSS